MRVLMDIAYTGAAAIALHPLRSFVTTACLMVALVPYLVVIGISKGIERDADLSIDAGADLYVSGTQFGKEVPVPEEMAITVRGLDGVADVFPRIVGPMTMGRNNEPAVVVGLPLNRVPADITCVEGRFFEESDVLELVMGSELARRLKIGVGDLIPPFYRSSQGERVCRVVGIFRSDVTLWQAHLVLASLDSAQLIFDQPGQVSELLVNCRVGYTDSVREQIERSIAATTDNTSPPFRVN